MPRNKPSLIGQRFGKLLVTGDAPRRAPFSFCLCDCGRNVVVSNYSLRAAKSTQCSLCATRKVGYANKTHGMSRAKIYKIWVGMFTRCTNPKSKSYKNYGARGIMVCERWGKFENFLEDMGHPPRGTSIERIRNEGNYEPGNCKWGTALEQSNNRRFNHVITVNGVTGSVASVARHFNIPASRIVRRLLLGWSPEDAVLKPKYIGGHPPKGTATE